MNVVTEGSESVHYEQYHLYAVTLTRVLYDLILDSSGNLRFDFIF